MNRFIAFLILWVCASPLYASTWIGNGGSLLDSELRGALSRIKSALAAVERDISPCECTGNSSQCALLKDLTEKQKEYCVNFILEISDELKSVIDDKSVKFVWSSQLRNNDRTFDAIASKSSKVIVIDEKRFATISQADRMQLVTHELLHLVDYDGQTLIDKGSRGPFQGEEGGRQLIDSGAAALVIIGMRAKALPYEESQFSKPLNNLYIDVLGGSRYLDSSFKKSSLARNFHDTQVLSVNWYPGHSDNLGFSIGSYSEFSNNEVLKGYPLVSEYSMRVLTLGVSYRVLPFEMGIEWIDSVQIAAAGYTGFGRVEQKIRDDYNVLKDSSNVSILGGEITVRAPLLWNFWLTLSQGVVYSPYELKQLGIKNTSVHSNNSLGLSYALSL